MWAVPYNSAYTGLLIVGIVGVLKGTADIHYLAVAVKYTLPKGSL